MKSDDNMQFMLDIMSAHHQIIQQKSEKHIWTLFGISKNIYFRNFEKSNQNIWSNVDKSPDSSVSQRVLIALKFLWKNIEKQKS